MIDNTAAVSVFDDAMSGLKFDAQCVKDRMKTLKSRKAKTIKTVGVIQRIVKTKGRVYLSLYGNQMEIRTGMYELDSFKQTELLDLLQYLMNYTDLNGGTFYNKEWPASLNRDYHFETEDIKFTVAAYVKADSEACRKVIIGTELVEQYKYEIVCD